MFFMLIGTLTVVLMIHYFVGKAFKKTLEGLTNQEGTMIGTNGLLGNSDGYSSSLSHEITVLHDKVMIEKYKSNYENILIELDELMKLRMLEIALSINPNNIDSSIQDIQLMNDLSKAVTSIDVVQSFVESSK